MAYNTEFIKESLNNNVRSDGRKLDDYRDIEIETGIRNKGNLEILSGLNEGDKIIAEGLTKVRPGMKVKPIIK